jgi:exopolyphosphatase/pppGpp-phosphohydrolase
MTANSPPTVAAAIDIGSNSIKMTIGRTNEDGGVDQLEWESEVVRLGQGLDRTGLLDEERIEAAIETLGRFARQARERGATCIVAVATEATRAAANGEMFLDRVRDQTGINVRVLDGQAEAGLTFRGLAADTDLNGSVLVADIGGGSTELIAACDGVMQVAQSLPLGSGRLTDRFIVADPPRTDELASCEKEADAVIQSARPVGLLADMAPRLIVVGGTGEFMARLITDDELIDLDAVRVVLSKLANFSVAELADEIDIPVARARVLPAGVAIVAAIASRVDPERIEISRSGIRAGLLLEALRGEGRTTDDGSESGAGSAEKPSAKDGNSPPGRQVSPEPSFRETMRERILERWQTALAAIPVALEGTDIEGVHDVRVASRRLRAAMDIAAPAFPGRWYSKLHRIAKEITGALGEVRDRDVLLEALNEDRSAAPIAEHPGIDRLIGRVERERVLAREEMERYLRRLLDGPLRGEVERRFGETETLTGATGTHGEGTP